MTSTAPAWSRRWRPIPRATISCRRQGRVSVPVWKFRVGPVVALDYAKAKVDGYTEDGDPVLTLNVSSVSYSSLARQPGA